MDDTAAQDKPQVTMRDYLDAFWRWDAAMTAVTRTLLAAAGGEASLADAKGAHAAMASAFDKMAAVELKLHQQAGTPEDAVLWRHASLDDEAVGEL